MPPGSLSTFAVMKPGPRTAKKAISRNLTSERLGLRRTRGFVMWSSPRMRVLTEGRRGGEGEASLRRDFLKQSLRSDREDLRLLGDCSGTKQVGEIGCVRSIAQQRRPY